jgi:hypothetical protein
MRDIRQGQCPLCQHDEIIQAAAADYPEGAWKPTPLAVTYDRAQRDPVTAALGAYNVFVCRSCGFTQWFASRPENIPIGEQHFTRLIRGPKSEGPYR